MDENRNQPTQEEMQQFKRLLERHPRFVFQQLNIWMNQDGLCLSIRSIEEAKSGANGNKSAHHPP
ncbi:hypothetical protein [Pectobacterium sp. LFLA-215]|uniref:hypothetical protein n=1 Tax=Pectobacterium sp. LFLA-215 TaxID=3419008 RepID=UPI003F5BDD8F